MHRPRPIRNVDAGDLIEMMLVVAVATIIVIRVILELMGYPKLGSGGLHIAHVLYGGLMMIGALILVFAFAKVLVNLMVNARDAMPRGGRIELATAPAEPAEILRRGIQSVPPAGYVRP